MNFLIAVKIFTDLCFYFGLTSGTAPWFGGTDLFLLWPALLCTAGVWLAAMGEKQPILRFAGFLTPLVSLLLVERVVDFVLLAPVLIYTVLIVLMRRFDLHREQYKTYFTRSLFVGGTLGLLIISYPSSNRQTLLFFMVLHLMLGFFLLLQLRLTSDGWCSRGLNMLSLLTAAALSGVLCLVAWLMLHLWDSVWNVVSNLLIQIAYATVFLSKFLPSLGSPDPKEFKQPGLGIGVNPVAEELQDVKKPTADMIWMIIGIATAVIIVTLVIWRMTMTMRKTKPVVDQMGQSERIDVLYQVGRGPFSSKRDKVRRSYRKFMQLLLSRGVTLKVSDTTADIQRSADFLRDTTPAYQLRKLYLTVRYNEGAKVTNQQVQKAKELVKTLSRDPEL